MTGYYIYQILNNKIFIFLFFTLLNKIELTSSHKPHKDEECVVPNPFTGENFDLRPRTAKADYWHLRFDLLFLNNVVPMHYNQNNLFISHIEANKLAMAISDDGFIDIYVSICHPLFNLDLVSSECDLWTRYFTKNSHDPKMTTAKKPICVPLAATSGCPSNTAVCGIVSTSNEVFWVSFGSFFQMENRNNVQFPSPLREINVNSGGTSRPNLESSRFPASEEHLSSESSTAQVTSKSGAVDIEVPTLPGFFGKDLALHYRNGSQCSEGSFSTQIIFKCSESESLELMPTLRECDLRFSLLTRDACSPATRFADACLFFQRDTGQIMNLTSLWNPNGYHLNTEDDQRFVFSVCGPLSKELCGGNSGATACLIESGEVVVVVGKQDGPIVREHNGSYIIKKERGQKCSLLELRYATTIRFLCTPNDQNNTQITVKLHKSTCSFTVDLKTNLACEVETLCTVASVNGFYDLSRLNSMKVTKTNFDGDVFIRACKPLEKEYGCPESSGICLVTARHSISLGQPKKNLYVDDHGNPSMHYEGGSHCPFISGRRFSSYISFHCVDDSKQELIEETGMWDECTLKFGWWTPEACMRTTAVENCSLVDEDTKSVLNFSSLDRPGGYVLRDSFTSKVLIINICNSLRNSNSSNDNSGAVEVSNDENQSFTSAGLSSSKIYLYNGLPSLMYVGSTSVINRHAKTVIMFMCIARGLKDQFYKMSYNEVTNSYQVIWYSEHACLPKHDCSVRFADGNIFSFQALRRPLGKYNLPPVEFDSRNYTILLNLCQPLPPTFNCSLGSSACLFNEETNITISLGFFNDPLRGSNTQDQPLYLNYSNGSLCNQKTNKGLRFSTKIIFLCGPGEGAPILKYHQECQFVFEWWTHFACPLRDNDKPTNTSVKMDKRSDADFRGAMMKVKKENIAKRSGEAEMPESHIEELLLNRNSPADNGNTQTSQHVDDDGIATEGIKKDRKMPKKKTSKETNDTSLEEDHTTKKMKYTSEYADDEASTTKDTYKEEDGRHDTKKRKQTAGPIPAPDTQEDPIKKPKGVESSTLIEVSKNDADENKYDAEVRMHGAKKSKEKAEKNKDNASMTGSNDAFTEILITALEVNHEDDKKTPGKNISKKVNKETSTIAPITLENDADINTKNKSENKETSTIAPITTLENDADINTKNKSENKETSTPETDEEEGRETKDKGISITNRITARNENNKNKSRPTNPITPLQWNQEDETKIRKKNITKSDFEINIFTTPKSDQDELKSTTRGVTYSELNITPVKTFTTSEPVSNVAYTSEEFGKSESGKDLTKIEMKNRKPTKLSFENDNKSKSASKLPLVKPRTYVDEERTDDVNVTIKNVTKQGQTDRATSMKRTLSNGGVTKSTKFETTAVTIGQSTPTVITEDKFQTSESVSESNIFEVEQTTNSLRAPGSNFVSEVPIDYAISGQSWNTVTVEAINSALPIDIDENKWNEGFVGPPSVLVDINNITQSRDEAKFLIPPFIQNIEDIEHEESETIDDSSTPLTTETFAPTIAPIETDFEFPIWASSLIGVVVVILMTLAIGLGITAVRRKVCEKARMYPRFAHGGRRTC